MPSSEAVKAERPSGESTAEKTLLSWLRGVRRHSPDSMHQSLAVRSSEAVQTERLSGERTAELTMRSRPRSVRKHSPDTRLQSLAVPSTRRSAWQTTPPDSEVSDAVTI